MANTKKKSTRKSVKSSKRTRFNSKIAIAAIIIMMAIGFAAVTTTLYINGTTVIKPDADDFVEGVIFDTSKIKLSSITDGKLADNDPNTAAPDTKAMYTISQSGRTVTITTQPLSLIGDSTTLSYAIKNNSQYNARIDSVTCYFVDSYEDDKEATSIGTTNEYITITPDANIVNTVIQAGGGISANAVVTVKQIKSYTGDKNNYDDDQDGILDSLAIRFQCKISSTAIEAEPTTTN